MILQLWAHTRVSLRCTCVTVCSISSTCVGNNPQSVCFSWLSEQEGETPASVFVNLFVCVYVANTEVAVVFMPAIRMLSLPTALFHLAQLCVRICEYVCVCLCVIRHSRCPLPHHQQWQGAMVHTHTHTLFLSLKILLVPLHLDAQTQPWQKNNHNNNSKK